jgi:hypothetical protein
MWSLKQFVLVIAAIQGFQSGIKNVSLSANPIYNIWMITNLIIEVGIHIFLAYKFTLICIILTVIREPLTKKIGKYMIHKLKAKIFTTQDHALNS